MMRMRSYDGCKSFLGRFDWTDTSVSLGCLYGDVYQKEETDCCHLLANVSYPDVPHKRDSIHSMGRTCLPLACSESCSPATYEVQLELAPLLFEEHNSDCCTSVQMSESLNDLSSKYCSQSDPGYFPFPPKLTSAYTTIKCHCEISDSGRKMRHPRTILGSTLAPLPDVRSKPAKTRIKDMFIKKSHSKFSKQHNRSVKEKSDDCQKDTTLDCNQFKKIKMFHDCSSRAIKKMTEEKSNSQFPDAVNDRRNNCSVMPDEFKYVFTLPNGRVKASRGMCPDIKDKQQKERHVKTSKDRPTSGRSAVSAMPDKFKYVFTLPDGRVKASHGMCPDIKDKQQKERHVKTSKDRPTSGRSAVRSAKTLLVVDPNQKYPGPVKIKITSVNPSKSVDTTKMVLSNNSGTNNCVDDNVFVQNNTVKILSSTLNNTATISPVISSTSELSAAQKIPTILCTAPVSDTGNHSEEVVNKQTRSLLNQNVQQIVHPGSCGDKIPLCNKSMQTTMTSLLPLPPHLLIQSEQSKFHSLITNEPQQISHGDNRSLPPDVTCPCMPINADRFQHMPVISKIQNHPAAFHPAMHYSSTTSARQRFNIPGYQGNVPDCHVRIPVHTRSPMFVATSAPGQVKIVQSVCPFNQIISPFREFSHSRNGEMLPPIPTSQYSTEIQVRNGAISVKHVHKVSSLEISTKRQYFGQNTSVTMATKVTPSIGKWAHCQLKPKAVDNMKDEPTENLSITRKCWEEMHPSEQLISGQKQKALILTEDDSCFSSDWNYNAEPGEMCRNYSHHRPSNRLSKLHMQTMNQNKNELQSNEYEKMSVKQHCITRCEVIPNIQKEVRGLCEKSDQIYQDYDSKCENEKQDGKEICYHKLGSSYCDLDPLSNTELNCRNFDMGCIPGYLNPQQNMNANTQTGQQCCSVADGTKSVPWVLRPIELNPNQITLKKASREIDPKLSIENELSLNTESCKWKSYEDLEVINESDMGAYNCQREKTLLESSCEGDINHDPCKQEKILLDLSCKDNIHDDKCRGKKTLSKSNCAVNTHEDQCQLKKTLSELSCENDISDVQWHRKNMLSKLSLEGDVRDDQCQWGEASESSCDGEVHDNQTKQKDHEYSSDNMSWSCMPCSDAGLVEENVAQQNNMITQQGSYSECSSSSKLLRNTLDIAEHKFKRNNVESDDSCAMVIYSPIKVEQRESTCELITMVNGDSEVHRQQDIMEIDNLNTCMVDSVVLDSALNDKEFLEDSSNDQPVSLPLFQDACGNCDFGEDEGKSETKTGSGVKTCRNVSISKKQSHGKSSLQKVMEYRSDTNCLTHSSLHVGRVSHGKAFITKSAASELDSTGEIYHSEIMDKLSEQHTPSLHASVAFQTSDRMLLKEAVSFVGVDMLHETYGRSLRNTKIAKKSDENHPGKKGIKLQSVDHMGKKTLASIIDKKRKYTRRDHKKSLEKESPKKMLYQFALKSRKSSFCQNPSPENKNSCASNDNLDKKRKIVSECIVSKIIVDKNQTENLLGEKREYYNCIINKKTVSVEIAQLPSHLQQSKPKYNNLIVISGSDTADMSDDSTPLTNACPSNVDGLVPLASEEIQSNSFTKNMCNEILVGLEQDLTLKLSHSSRPTACDDVNTVDFFMSDRLDTPPLESTQNVNDNVGLSFKEGNRKIHLNKMAKGFCPTKLKKKGVNADTEDEQPEIHRRYSKMRHGKDILVQKNKPLQSNSTVIVQVDARQQSEHEKCQAKTHKRKHRSHSVRSFCQESSVKNDSYSEQNKKQKKSKRKIGEEGKPSDTDNLDWRSKYRSQSRKKEIFECVEKIKSSTDVSFRLVTSKEQQKCAKNVVLKCCDYCHMYFRAAYVGTHMREHHKYRCTSCLMVFSTKDEKQEHHSSVHVDRMYHCILCQCNFVSLKVFQRHLKSKSHLQFCRIQHQVMDSVFKACQPIPQISSGLDYMPLRHTDNSTLPQITEAKQTVAVAVAASEALPHNQNDGESQLELFYQRHPEFQQLLNKIDKKPVPNNFLRTEVEGKIKHFYYQNPEVTSLLTKLRQTVAQNLPCISEYGLLPIASSCSLIDQSVSISNQQFANISDNYTAPSSSQDSMDWLSMAVQTLNDLNFGVSDIQQGLDSSPSMTSLSNNYNVSFIELLQSGNDVVDHLLNGGKNELSNNYTGNAVFSDGTCGESCRCPVIVNTARVNPGHSVDDDDDDDDTQTPNMTVVSNNNCPDDAITFDSSKSLLGDPQITNSVTVEATNCFHGDTQTINSINIGVSSNNFYGVAQTDYSPNNNQETLTDRTADGQTPIVPEGRGEGKESEAASIRKELDLLLLEIASDVKNSETF